MPLRFTRAIINAIHTGKLVDAPIERDEIMGLAVVTQCPGVPSEMLLPRLSWQNVDSYEQTARKLAARFRKNFEQYATQLAAEVTASGPVG